MSDSRKTKPQLIAELEQLREKIRRLERSSGPPATEAEAAPQAAIENGSLFHLDRIPVMLHSTDAEGHLLSVSDEWLATLGYERQDVIGKMITDYVSPASRQAIDSSWLPELLSRGLVTRKPLQFQTRSGDPVDVVLSAVIERSSTGEILRSVAVSLDISEMQNMERKRRRAEEALGQSEERYRRFFEDDLSGGVITSVGGRILACNPSFARMFAFDSVAAALGQRMKSLYIRPAAREDMLSRLSKGRQLEHYRMTEMRRRDGAPIYVDANVIPQFDAQGQLVEIHGYLQDMTEHKRLEDQLLQSQKMEAIGRLAGGVAHDFNNVLTAILGYGELLLADPLLDGTQRSRVEEIRRATERAADLTRQLLAFSRRQILRPRVLDLERVVSGMEPMLRRLIGEDIELRTEKASRLWSVRADPTQIEQVILNLVVNCRDALPEGGEVSLALENAEIDGEMPGERRSMPAGAYVRLSVTDTGIGIDEETKPHVFEPFFSTKEQGGTGLGLSTVYGIVKQSGGFVWLESEPGTGTRVEIWLPRATGSVEEPESTGRRPFISGTETILLVEDEESVRSLACLGLRRHGYTVLEAADADRAMNICRQHRGPIHLMVTDVVMPRMSGPELAERLAPERPDMKVLFMSGYADRLLAGDTEERVLQKPFTPQTLAHRVRELLGTS